MAESHKEIIMSYDKLSLASFKEALKSGKYVNATGARRAVGKATTLSDADKDKARQAIDAHFGSEPAAAPKKTAPKKTAAAAPKKQAAPKKTAAAAPKKTAAAKPAPKKAGAKRGPRAAAPVEAVTSDAVASSLGLGDYDLENTSSIGTQLRIAEKTIQNVGAALAVITQAKEKYPEADLANVVEEMGGTLAGAVGVFRQVVHMMSSNDPPKDAEPAAAPQPVAGVVNNGVLSRGEALFAESGPESAAAAQG